MADVLNIPFARAWSRPRRPAYPPLVDCFTFFNELDLLELRLRYLYDIVDAFVLVESPLTHSGISKPLHYLENLDRFAWASDKIIHIVEELPHEANDAWVRENQQRNAISKGLESVDESSVIIISDLDEIPDKRVVSRHRSIADPITLQQKLHYYFVNCRGCGRKNRRWNGAVMLPLSALTTPQEMREASLWHGRFRKIRDGGWHFSYLGGSESIKTKLQAFAHSEFNLDEYKNDVNIAAALEEGRDLYGREDMGFEYIRLSKFPRELAKLIAEYPHFVRSL